MVSPDEDWYLFDLHDLHFECGSYTSFSILNEKNFLHICNISFLVKFLDTYNVAKGVYLRLKKDETFAFDFIDCSSSEASSQVSQKSHPASINSSLVISSNTSSISFPTPPLCLNEQKNLNPPTPNPYTTEEPKNFSFSDLIPDSNHSLATSSPKSLGLNKPNTKFNPTSPVFTNTSSINSAEFLRSKSPDKSVALLEELNKKMDKMLSSIGKCYLISEQIYSGNLLKLEIIN